MMMKLICLAMVCAIFVQGVASLKCQTGDTDTHPCKDCGNLGFCYILTNVGKTSTYYGCDDSSATNCKKMRTDKFGGNGACVTRNSDAVCGSGSGSHNTGTGLGIMIISAIVLFLRL